MGMKSSLRLYGGVVTQRIANPLSPLENIKFFLAKIAQTHANRVRTCKTLFTGAAALALAGCGMDTAFDHAEGFGYRFGEACREFAGANACAEVCNREFTQENWPGYTYVPPRRAGCLRAAYGLESDPAPELAGGREVAP